MNLVLPVVRTITAFVTLSPSDFLTEKESQTTLPNALAEKVSKCSALLKSANTALTRRGYVVQTVRISTNPFGEYLLDDEHTDNESCLKTVLDRLRHLDTVLEENDIQFCSVGPSHDPAHTIRYCPEIVKCSPRLSCSAAVGASDVEAATAAAECIVAISRLGVTTENLEPPSHVVGGLGNFQFCAASSCKAFIPFFPGSKSISGTDGRSTGGLEGFALGLENGNVAQSLLQQTKSLDRIDTVFRDGMVEALSPLEGICDRVSSQIGVEFLGIDSSLNPSLGEDGSVADAMEMIREVDVFGGRGTLATAAAITTVLQSLPVKSVGYCGLMLPVCEDKRLAALASRIPSQFRIPEILSVSSVCGVGIDTVPVAGDCSIEELTSVILDVAGLAGRWDKSLSCRVFPVPGSKAGDLTLFDSPYLCNSRIFSL